MTASWPAFIGGAALVFVVFNAVFAVFYWIGDQPIANVPGGAYIDYLYFSIETLSTAGYGDMHPQTHYGHFIAAVELFTGIFSMSLMTGLIFARFSRPNARLLFADNPVISNHEGKPTLMVRFANERHNIIGNATAKLWLLRNEVSLEGEHVPAVLRAAADAKRAPGAGLELDALPCARRAKPALRARRRRPRGIRRSRWWWWCPDMMLLRRKPSTPENPTIIPTFASATATPISSTRTEDGRLRIDYGRFHETFEG